MREGRTADERTYTVTMILLSIQMTIKERMWRRDARIHGSTFMYNRLRYEPTTYE